MKKNLFFCILMMLMCLSPQLATAQSNKGVNIALTGKIGDSEGYLNMDGLNGSYSYKLPNGKVERRLEFVSYDKKTGRLVLKARDKQGKYVGQFNGIYKSVKYTENGEQLQTDTYKGIFTNMKGVKIDFDLYMD
ncbi:MAG: hypothetical protein IKW98_09505 [Prevotella sp.]|nr:hypothetical protein [Prevotella sp.]